MSEHATRILPRSASTITAVAYVLPYGHLGGKILLPCFICEDQVNFSDLPQLFFGQTQHLSFQIDALEMKALNLDQCFLRWGFLVKAIFTRRKGLHYTEFCTLGLLTN